MPHRDDREAPRAQVERLQQELEQGKQEADVAVLPENTNPHRWRQARVAGGVVVAVAALGIGGWQWSERAADREIGEAWGGLSTCLFGEPLAPGELAAARVRRIQLAYVTMPKGSEGHWPQRCQKPARRLFQVLHEDGREQSGVEDAAYWAGHLATQLDGRMSDDDFLQEVDAVERHVRAGHIVAVGAPGDTPAPPPAKPLRLGDLAGAAVTTVDTQVAKLYLDPLPGPDRHVLIDAPGVDPAVLCTVTAQAETVTCRPLPGDVGHQHRVRLFGTADAGAAPLVSAEKNGEYAIYRSDTGERVVALFAVSGYAAKDGYVAIQIPRGTADGGFDVYEQRGPGAPVQKTTVTAAAQDETRASMGIHASRLLWDKAILEVLDQDDPHLVPWVAYRTFPREGAGGGYHPVATIDFQRWIDTTITGCRGTRGMVARFGPDPGYLLFNEEDRWQGPVFLRHDLGEMRCDGADAVFLSAWPPRVERCMPRGCETETTDSGSWLAPLGRPVKRLSRSAPAFELVDGGFAVDFADGGVAVAWVTEQYGVRFRIGSAAHIGQANDGVVFDDRVGDDGQLHASVVSGLRLVAAGRGAVLFLATREGIRAIRLAADGTFAPARIAH